MVGTSRRCRSVPPTVVEVNYDYGVGSRKAQRIANYLADDHDSLRAASRRQDAALLRDITSRMYRLDFESVKPDSEISQKTGFRRLIHQRKRDPITKDMKESRRRDRLRYPWDYTANNIYHTKTTPKVNKDKVCLYDRIHNTKVEEPKDPYPEYDPMGIYRPRPKVKHIEYGADSKVEKEIKSMAFSELLVKAKARAALIKTEVDPSDENDIMFERFINRPIPRQELEVTTYVPVTGDLYDFDVKYQDAEKLDPATSLKIEESRRELDEFNRILDSKFNKKIHKFMTPNAPALVRGAKRSSALYMLAEPGTPIAREANVVSPVADEDVQDQPADKTERELSTGWEDPYYYEYADEYVHSPVRPYRQAAYAGARLESMMAPDPVSMYAGLRSRTAEARSKMDTHKVMLDRCLPIYLGPEREVGYEVEKKYDELAVRYTR